MKSPLTLFASLMMLFGIVTMNSCTKNDIPELGTLKIESKVKEYIQKTCLRIHSLGFILMPGQKAL